MLNKHSKIKVIREAVPYTKNVNIHEHKAPTDESLKLLKEYQEKAKQSIISTYEVTDNNLFNAKVLVFQKPDYGREYEVVMIFSINNQRFEIKEKIAENNLTSHTEWIKNLREKLTAAVMHELFKDPEPEVLQLFKRS